MTAQAQIQPLKTLGVNSKGTQAALKAHATRKAQSAKGAEYPARVEEVKTALVGLNPYDASCVLRAAYRALHGSTSSASGLSFADLMAEPIKAGAIVKCRLNGKTQSLPFAGRAKKTRALQGFGYVMTEDGTAQARILKA